MQDVRMGIYYEVHDITLFPELARRTEEAGFQLIGIPDSQASVFRELMVCLTVLALNTTRARIGPVVSNPVTRHPAVAANAMATLRELAGDRVFVGLGTGDSAVFSIGLKPTTLARLREYAVAVRDLMAGEPAHCGGTALRLVWPHFRVPIFLAPEGPRGLRMAGQIADGVFLGTGVAPEIIASGLEHIREGAEAAGRRASDVDVWLRPLISIRPDHHEALEEVKPLVAAVAHSVFRSGAAEKQVPARYLEPLERLQRGYQVTAHAHATTDNPNATLIDELGLTEYLIERFAIAGTPEECAQQLRAMHRSGVRQFCLRPMAQDKTEFMRLWKEDVLPRL